MSSWNGKSKGSVLGYKIFVFAIEKTGLGAAYFILRFVSFYYFLFSWKTSSCLYYYFRNRLRYNPVKSVLRIYSNYYLVGQTLIDKIAVLAGYKTKFAYTIEGAEHLMQIVNGNKGGILISAHVGNWELAGHMLRGIAAKVNIVMYEGEHTAIKKYMDSITKEKNFNLIIVNDKGLNHIYEINAALENKELVCMHGDRFVKGSKTTLCDFLGEQAFFPVGPFLLATQLQVPVSFVFSLKKSASHYFLHASPLVLCPATISRQQRDTEALSILKLYVQSLEKIIYKYPNQWFNYYHFWKTT